MDERIHLLSSEALFHDDEDSIAICPISIATYSNGLENRNLESQTIQAPDLPESKLYHLFVCYATEDRDKAFEFVKELENKHGAKCLFADRDFQPGKEIRINIMEGIDNSVKILTVLSPRFAESRYCLHESEIAFQKSMETGLNYVIPVLLEACEVPFGLKPKTYIDATLPDVTVADVAERIISALHLPNSTDTPLSFEMISSENKYKNGFSFDLEAQLHQCFVLKPSGYQFHMTSDAVRMLKASGVEVSVKQLQKAIKLINHHSVLRWHDLNGYRKICLFSLCSCPALLLLAFAALFLSGLSLWSEKGEESMNNFDSAAGYTLCTIAAVLGSAILGVCICLCGKQTLKRKRLQAKEHLWRCVTLKTYRDGLIFSFTYTIQEVPVLRVIRYDVKRCRVYIVGILRRKYGCDEEIDLDCETQATVIIEQWLKTMCSKQLTCLPDALTSRHNVVQDKMCICQLYEHYGY